jgi:hypothetical protein
MAVKTVQTWADSGGLIIRDSLDTCVVQVVIDGTTYVYSIDMQKGLIFNLDAYGDLGAASQRYLYGYDKGIYYLRRVCCNSPDTTIDFGGYDFYNIRVNGVAMTGVRPERRIPSDRFAINNGKANTRHGDLHAGTMVALYDLQGRRKRIVPYRGATSENGASGFYFVKIPGSNGATLPVVFTK